MTGRSGNLVLTSWSYGRGLMADALLTPLVLFTGRVNGT